VKATLPAGSAVEVTLELDRGGRLSATARVPSLDQVFDQVAHLIAPQVPVAELADRMDALRTRATSVRADAMRKGLGATATMKLGDLEGAFADLAKDVERARGGDQDAAEKARRALLEIDAQVADVDADLAWPGLDGRVREQVAWATSWLAPHGTDEERLILQETIAAMSKARTARDAAEIERQLRIVTRLGWGAYYRNPGAWEEQFDYAASRVDRSSDLRRANELVREGRKAVANNDKTALERIVRDLWKLAPVDEDDRQKSYSSGVR
jgi:molecular chaperone DnaK